MATSSKTTSAFAFAAIALPFVAGFQSGQTLLIRDCIHPNDAGHDLITNVAVQAFSNH